MKRILAGIIVLAVLMVSGCVSSDTANNTTSQPPVYEKHTLVCPNPDCPLHDPNGRLYFTGNAARGLRPIDCEVTSSGYSYHYVCQVCGEQWDVRI